MAQLRYSLKTKQKTLNTKPRGTWTVFRCSEPLPWVCTPGFVPLWAISSSPAHLSSVPVSGISQFQVGKTILTGLGKRKKFLLMEIPSTLNQYFIHVWEIPLRAVSILICFSISCFNSETKCVTRQEGLGPIPDQWNQRGIANSPKLLFLPDSMQNF